MDFSYQLYSARNFPPLGSILRELASLGYKQVEGFGGLYNDPDALARELREAGLVMPTGHFGLDDLKDGDKAMKTAETLGMKAVFCPAIPADQRSQDDADWQRLGETLAQLGERYRRAGFRFGWHNHDFEFRPIRSGKLPMDILLDAAPDNDWEMDVAWVVRGGHDPLEWMQKHGRRITAIHVKDIAPEGQARDEDGWADVGQGTMDWPALAKAAKAQTRAQYFVMEHDNPSDALRFARRSIEAGQNFGI